MAMCLKLRCQHLSIFCYIFFFFERCISLPPPQEERKKSLKIKNCSITKFKMRKVAKSMMLLMVRNCWISMGTIERFLQRKMRSGWREISTKKFSFVHGTEKNDRFCALSLKNHGILPQLSGIGVAHLTYRLGEISIERSELIPWNQGKWPSFYVVYRTIIMELGRINFKHCGGLRMIKNPPLSLRFDLQVKRVLKWNVSFMCTDVRYQKRIMEFCHWNFRDCGGVWIV